MKLVVCQATQKVLGAHMLGEDAAEIMQGIGIAVAMGATKQDFDRTIGIHPTAAEEFVTLRTRTREAGRRRQGGAVGSGRRRELRARRRASPMSPSPAVPIGHFLHHVLTGLFLTLAVVLERVWERPFDELIALWTIGAFLIGARRAAGGLARGPLRP